VIDISPFIADPEAADGEEAKKRVARAVHDACVESGFFLISNYQGVLPQDKVDGLLQLMRRFFSLSPAYKRQLKGSYGRGTLPFFSLSPSSRPCRTSERHRTQGFGLLASLRCSHASSFMW
jgi:isopenicillin N synthase-like dioxygenase